MLAPAPLRGFRLLAGSHEKAVLAMPLACYRGGSRRPTHHEPDQEGDEEQRQQRNGHRSEERNRADDERNDRERREDNKQNPADERFDQEERKQKDGQQK